MSKRHSITNSFGYAWQGLRTAIKDEPNFRVHTIIAITAVALGFYLGLTPTEWLLLILVIAAVLVLELINTSLEAMVDIVSPQIRPKAKVAKDVISAAVLVSAFAAVIVGILLFGPKVINLLYS